MFQERLEGVPGGRSWRAFRFEISISFGARLAYSTMSTIQPDFSFLMFSQLQLKLLIGIGL